jgi:hypothetical protein
MRWRFRLVLCLFVAYIGVGCREPMAPNIDRNQAPETWITAAPFDTITLKDADGKVIDPRFPGILPEGNRIPVRFHLHWAGSDRDGAVAGFYWAVVETLPRPPVGDFFIPNLPGPKPQDYRFTTKTDSFFIFNVAEDLPDRQHAFFIYAVDNLGKPDPTPARFIFLAQDRFPPIPKFDECTCEGDVYEVLPGGGVVKQREKKFITDVDTRERAPRDTCAANSKLTFSWHAEVVIPQTTVTGFRYKLDEPTLVSVGPEVTMVTYNSGIPPDTIPPSPGIKLFLLRAVDQAGGSQDSTRRFQLNYAPDTWWSGPDPNSISWQVHAGTGEKYAPFINGQLPPGGVQGSLMAPDSLRIFPAFRTARRTFMEVYKDTLWLRQEGDTVNMNSWVIVHGGGYDRDSDYRVKVNPIMFDREAFPDFPTQAEAPVLVQGPPNGSPIGFRSIVSMSLSPNNSPSSTALSNLYPVFDPNDVFHEPRIAGYHPVFQSGRAFVVIQAEDADGDRDRRVQDGRELVTNVESGTATPYERSLRGQVIAFHVNKAPRLVPENPLFRPRMSVVDTFYSSTWDLRLDAVDPDPHQPNSKVGGPSTIVTFRRKLRVVGTHVDGGQLIYDDPIAYVNQQNITLTVPPNLAPGLVTLVVELCDCDRCEDLPGSGRCRTYQIPVYYQPSGPTRPPQ